MATAVGVDWAGNGWVAAVLDGTGATVEFYPTMLNCWRAHRGAETILIDMPIGLRETGKRACDLAAADELGGERPGSVFLTPTREAVYAPTIEAAKERQEPADFGVQNQVWAIVPRIRELDGFLQEYAETPDTDRIREAHPELCVAGLNGGAPIGASKSTEAGRAARLSVLEDRDPRLDDAYHEAVETLTKPSYATMIGASKTDDILDALALATTAALEDTSLRTLPADPGHDPVLDRPIEIVAPAID
jgi:predicted RNase H-like nuclease